MRDGSGDGKEGFGRAATIGLFAAIVLMAAVRGALMDTGLGNLVELLLGGLVGAVVVIIAALIVAAMRLLAHRVPELLAWALGVAVLAMWFFDANSMADIAKTALDPDSWELPLGWPRGLDIVSLLIVALAAACTTGLVYVARAADIRRFPVTILATVILLSMAGWIAAFLIRDGADPFVTDFSNFVSDATRPARIADPSRPGDYSVQRLSYGAGDNRRRAEFGASRDFESRTVDASRLLPDWKGLKQRMRERYWGFGLEEAPLNGLVWAPDGEGPFPLVLVVHGNHAMEDYSDPGYAYLGELLASRGFITVSVDQNYINGTWSGDFRGKEMPARAWLLLEHLRLWRDWSADDAHPLGGRVDMDRISLVGHSRGGEAVAIAGAFNELPHYPDDANVEFDYGFNIRSLVAIAQVDQRYERRVELENVSFLALQGSYDSDEPAFHGLRQYNRIAFTNDAYHFKAGVYIHGANHGQFNSTWGRTDYSPPGSWLLNLAPIIPADDQRRIAQVYISAFIEATLNDDHRYLALFRDPRVGATWLPDHPYVQQFTDSTFRPLATFDEDLDLRSGSFAGVTLQATGVSVWREEELKHRDERRQGTSAVVLGWTVDDNPSYTVSVPESFWERVDAQTDALSLSISASTETVPEDAGNDENDAESDDGTTEPPAPVATIEAIFGDGRVTSADSRDHAVLAPPFRVRYLKHEGDNEDRYKADWEPVLQLLEVPLGALLNGADPGTVRELRIRFSDMAEGVVILDDIGVRRTGPAVAGDQL